MSKQETRSETAHDKRRLASILAFLAGQGARAGYLATADQGMISLSNFMATLILARGASPTELGVYGVGFTALRLGRAVQEGLTIQPMNTFGPDMDEDDFRRYATGTSLIQIALALLCAGATALLGWILIKTGNDTAGPGIFALWPAILFWQLQEYLRRMLYTRGQVWKAALNTGVANAVRLAFMFWWISQGELSGAAGLTAIAYGAIAALPFGIWQTRTYWGRDLGDIGEIWKRNWGFGRWMLGSNIANWTAAEFYPVLTAGLVSFAAAGAYRALQNLVAPIHLLLRAIDNFLTPRAARRFQQGGFPALGRLMRLTYLGAGVPIAGLLVFGVVFAGPLLKLLYGETYLPYQDGIYLMAIFYGLWFAYWPLQSSLKAASASRPIFYANIAAIAAMFTAGVWMVYQWGVYGTIAGQALNALIINIVLWGAWGRIRRIKAGVD